MKLRTRPVETQDATRPHGGAFWRRLLVTTVALIVATAGIILAGRSFLGFGPPPESRSRSAASAKLGEATNGLIAFTSGDGGYAIDGINADGTGRIDITNPKGWEYDLGPRWSPDGTKIAFLRYTNLDEDGMGNYEIHVANADGTDVRNLTGDGGADGPEWSPDGRRLVFSSYIGDAHGLFIIGSDGSGERLLIDDPVYDMSPNWSPDGSKIVFDRGFFGNDRGSDIYVVATNGTGLRSLTTAPGYEQDPKWSPDGTRIAYMGDQSGSNQVWVMNSDGTGHQQLTDMPAGKVSDLAWSPNGSAIAFNVYAKGNWDVWVVDADGSDLRPLADTRDAEISPTWAPDGSWIAYSASDTPPDTDNSGSFELYVVRPDGTSRNRITRSADELGGDLHWQAVYRQSSAIP
jgi:TolB protein